jgi:hypothetical protein
MISSSHSARAVRTGAFGGDGRADRADRLGAACSRPSAAGLLSPCIGRRTFVGSAHDDALTATRLAAAGLPKLAEWTTGGPLAIPGHT